MYCMPYWDELSSIVPLTEKHTNRPEKETGLLCAIIKWPLWDWNS